MTSDQFFEGTEKLLEIWFGCSKTEDLVTADLRMISRSDLDDVLKVVNCQILSQCCDEFLTAYILSESSLFVSKTRLILKTCGRTTLLAAIQPILTLARHVCGFDTVVDIFYSHKNYLKPDMQPSVHQTFVNEVDALDEHFGNGQAMALGRVLKGDCWYLYTTDKVGVTEPDQTLERISEDVLTMFRQDFGLTASEITKLSGIADLCPNATLDEFLFAPCGYSLNGILKQGHYFTIHVTPEPDFSYISFETNVPEESYAEIINRVAKIFKPSKLLLTFMSNKGSIVDLEKFRNNVPQQRDRGSQIAELKCTEHHECVVQNYSVFCSFYQRTNTLS